MCSHLKMLSLTTSAKALFPSKVPSTGPGTFSASPASAHPTPAPQHSAGQLPLCPGRGAGWLAPDCPPAETGTQLCVGGAVGTRSPLHRGRWKELAGPGGHGERARDAFSCWTTKPPPTPGIPGASGTHGLVSPHPPRMPSCRGPGTLRHIAVGQNPTFGT